MRSESLLNLKGLHLFYFYHNIQFDVSVTHAHTTCTHTHSSLMFTTDIVIYYSNTYQIYVILCVGEKNDKTKIVCSFPVIKVCLVINVLNNNTIILLNLVVYPLNLVHLAITALSAEYQAIFCVIPQDNC